VHSGDLSKFGSFGFALFNIVENTMLIVCHSSVFLTLGCIIWSLEIVPKINCNASRGTVSLLTFCSILCPCLNFVEFFVKCILISA